MSNGVASPRAEPAESLLGLVATTLQSQFGAPFYFFEVSANAPIAPFGSADPVTEPPNWLTDLVRQVGNDERVSVCSIDDLLQVLLIHVSRGHRTELIAAGIFATRPIGSSDHAQLRQWLPRVPAGAVPFCQSELLSRLGHGAQAAIADRQRLACRDAELRQLASQLTRNYEEITLLHQLAREAQVSHGSRAFQELALTLLAELLEVPQVVFVELSTGFVVSRGTTLLPLAQVTEFVQGVAERAKRGVLVENAPARHDGARRFHQISRVIALPVTDRNEQCGWLLALGRPEDPDVGSVEASLMTAVAAIMATHHANVQLYSSLKDLFLGVVRSLSSAIDAKDPYTCGHSERVGRLARRLGQELGLPDDECNRIYLSGLLHDVGKIGVRDAVLLKPGRLDPEEQAHIQEHPRIGYEILSGVRQLRPVLAGVRNHHENFDGTGYPDKLRAEEIPLMARIIAVADSYDAMSSSRPYRKGLDDDQIERNFRAGMGEQWDPKVVEALLAIRGEFAQKSSARQNPPTRESPSNGDGPKTRPPLDLSKISRLISLGSA